MSSTATDRACRPLYRDGQIGLRKAVWLRMDPVTKWTILVDLARRGPYLLERGNVEHTRLMRFIFCIRNYFSKRKSCLDPSEPQKDMHTQEKTQPEVLGQDDDQVHFTPTSTIHHAFICQALPYATRLQLALSLLLWLRCLRDVQDTLARLRTPFAHNTRLGNSLLAHVFPTRLTEHWVDPFTHLSVKMNEKLNGTGEQVPAPHTWDPETVEDDGSEWTVSLGGERAPHGKRAVSRAALLDRVQGLTPRPSADDEHVARLVGVGSNRRQRRLHLVARQNSGHFPFSTTGDSASENIKPSAGTDRTTIQWANTDSNRVLPPSPLDSNPLEDAAYHANNERGEGCPLSNHGTVSSSPIHIPGRGSRVWDGCGSTLDIHNAALEVEATLGRCVQAHAAILSSLFIEGRVVQFTTTDPVVYHYVLWLFEELIIEKYIFCKLIQEKDESVSTQLMPYYPPWCFRSVLALLPPATERIKKSEAANLAGLILRAAPCDVLIENVPSICTDNNSEHESPNRSESGGASVTSYIAQVQEEVEKQRQVLMKTISCKNQPHKNGSKEANTWRVSWVFLRSHQLNYPNDKGTPTVNNNEEYSRTPNSSGHLLNFVTNQENVDPNPKYTPGVIRMHFHILLTSYTTKILNFLISVYQRWTSNSDVNLESTKRQRRGKWFIEQVNSVVEDRIHALQLLCLSHNCILPQRHLQEWVWEQLPCSLRLVGVNTSPWDALFFFPQVPFLSHKVGNAFRFRAVERVVVAKHAAAFGAGPLRRLAGRSFWLRGGKGWERTGLHARLNTLDRARLLKAQNCHSKNTEKLFKTLNEANKIVMKRHNDKAADMLVTERSIDYLANPNKLTWIGLVSAIVFRL
ncbi:unnamed protein product [Phytomonas sp. Hart1]|nr:unnamed protein product [Phytomonas sp. Hart1]|eukprot:CCW66179.1 unnamed protein product [Phytomonas sp. isolate Hart1]